MSKQPPRREGPPPKYPDTAPPLNYSDSSYLEMVVELHKSMAQMGEKVHALEEASKAHGITLNQIAKDVHTAKVALYIFSGIIAVGGGALAWFINKAWDLAMRYLPAATH